MISDGAAAVVVARESAAARSGRKPLARIVASATSGGEPEDLFTAPVDAVRSVVAKAGRSLDDVDLFEINEAFAVQMLACIQQLDIPPDRVNVSGGAIALGHPIGASGARVLVRCCMLCSAAAVESASPRLPGRRQRGRDACRARPGIMNAPLSIGDIQLSFVSGGRLRIDGGNMFGVIPRLLWERESPPDDQHRISLATNCIRRPHARFAGLIDTGYGSKSPPKFRQRHALEDGAPLVKNLAAAGIAPDDLDWVILTHLHFDHAGGARLSRPRWPTPANISSRSPLHSAGRMGRCQRQHSRAGRRLLSRRLRPAPRRRSGAAHRRRCGSCPRHTHPSNERPHPRPPDHPHSITRRIGRLSRRSLSHGRTPAIVLDNGLRPIPANGSTHQADRSQRDGRPVIASPCFLTTHKSRRPGSRAYPTTSGMRRRFHQLDSLPPLLHTDVCTLRPLPSPPRRGEGAGSFRASAVSRSLSNQPLNRHPL